MDREELIKTIDAYKQRLGLSDSAIGHGALNDSKFVMRLREGRRAWPETAMKVIAHLEALEEERTRLSTICTEDGTWIALDKRSGLAHSGRSEKAATENLRKKLEQQAAQ